MRVYDIIYIEGKGEERVLCVAQLYKEINI